MLKNAGIKELFGAAFTAIMDRCCTMWRERLSTEVYWSFMLASRTFRGNTARVCANHVH